ncbi:MAG: N-acetyl-gamma-glutamyl-phosphate reductase [Ruminococcus sp.]|nr:N-acetyl-gamma-glutamyl-phosphate reductase [Ruminococcus sp.]
MSKIYIDGSAGTTGLRIRERLSERKDIELLTLPDDLRKDPAAKKEIFNQADIVFLCLPDEAARESVKLIEGAHTVIIDTSTAHRTDGSFVYGMPEIRGQREKIKTAKKIANPGCHASGFIALVEPLVTLGLLKENAKLSCFSLTGYSGGGKKMIAQYEEENRVRLFDAPRMYALSQSHKHLPEMKKFSHLENDPVFCPVVCDFYSGMQVTVPVFKDDLNGSLNDIKEAYKSYYQNGLIHFEDRSEEGFLSSLKFEGRDDMAVSAFGNDDRITLVSRFDNLGKGASGAAIQNMNIVLGCEETTGLIL